jgi:MFS superfamily sulfate permease-like transporter
LRYEANNPLEFRPTAPEIAALTTSTKRNSSLLPDWLVYYRSEWLKPDVIAGLTTAAVVIPKAMAYGTIAGLPVQVGLYTAFLPMVIYAVLGVSRVLSVSTTTTIAILTAAELGEVVPNGDPAGLLGLPDILYQRDC